MGFCEVGWLVNRDVLCYCCFIVVGVVWCDSVRVVLVLGVGVVYCLVSGRL